MPFVLPKRVISTCSGEHIFAFGKYLLASLL
jgi:hypothetical protein